MCQILEIRIPKLGNSDAIIIALQKADETLVVLIDAGRPHQIHAVLSELVEVLSKYNKPGPDLIICTHYDHDHIGGIEPIAGRFKIHIREVWMHKTHRLIEIVERLESTDDPSALLLPNEEAENLGIHGNGIVDYQDDDIQFMLQQLKHEIETLKALEEMGIKVKEPIQGHCMLENWPEIEVIGPTMEYYQRLFPEHFQWDEFLNQAKQELQLHLTHNGDEHTENPFDALDAVRRTLLTPTNLNSAIIQINATQGKFLFAADAGIDSFRNIPDYKNKLRNVHFLKVPHHGSANNLNAEMIHLINPEIAFISGGSHISPLVVDALKANGSAVHTTNDSTITLVYPIQ